MGLTPEELEQFVAELAATPERWAPLVRHSSGERVYEQICDQQDVNAWTTVLIGGVWLVAQGGWRLIGYVRRHPSTPPLESFRP